MRWNYSDIKQELIDNWQQLQDSTDPYDLLHQFADSAVPVYYGEIIKDWQEMPSDFADSWAEFGLPEFPTITNLMSIDLYEYYHDQYHTIYNELLEEKETANA